MEPTTEDLRHLHKVTKVYIDMVAPPTICGLDGWPPVTFWTSSPDSQA